jgi:acetyl-CoA acetyltransferase
VSVIMERQAVISGIGQSAMGRRLGRSGLDLALDAAQAALSDAGLDRTDIDGIATGSGYATAPGASPVSTLDVKEALGLSVNWYSAASDSSQMSALISACMAVASGQSRHVLVFRAVTEASSRMVSVQPDQARRVDGVMEWHAPFHAHSAANWIGLMAARYFHEFGTTRQQLAQIALNGRRNAMLTADAVYRAPMSLDDYLAARMVSTPLCLFDCDVPIDGAVAMVVSHVDTMKDMRSPSIRIEAICGPLHAT